MTTTTITSNTDSTVVIDGSNDPLIIEAFVTPTSSGAPGGYSGPNGVYSAFAGTSLTLGGGLTSGGAVINGDVIGGTASGSGEVGGIGVDLTAFAHVSLVATSRSAIVGGTGLNDAAGGAGVSMAGGGDLSVGGSCEIQGGSGYGGGGGTGVEVTGSGLTTVTVTGEISGGTGFVSAHSGTGGVGGTGVSLSGNSVLDNDGQVVGGSGVGVDGGVGLILSNGARAVNEATAQIEGNGSSVGVNFTSVGATAVVLNAGTSLDNDGFIFGGTSAGSHGSGGVGASIGPGATLTNAYKIIGGSDSAVGGSAGAGVYLNDGILIDTVTSHTAIISGGSAPTGETGLSIVGAAVQFGTLTGGELVLGGGAALQGAIAGMRIGDTIDLSNLTLQQVQSGFTLNGNVSATIATPEPQYASADITLTGNFSGEKFEFISIDDGAGTQIRLEAACYLRGTRIRTPTGDTPIEDLCVGDAVLTASGAAQPVRWLGHRSIDCTRHPNPTAVWPIRIQAGALGDGLPARDLWVSPGHSLAVEGVLLPAHLLVNGACIVQVPRARVDYWHVELAKHDILLAEGLPAESYLDTGNRSAFVGGGAFLEAHPDFKPKHWADTCLPLVMAGPELERVRAMLRMRAEALGYRLTPDADTHILVDGQRILPLPLAPQRVAFLLPAAGRTIELCCRPFVPAHVDGTSADRRTLGVCVARLQLDGVDVPLEDEAAFAVGWHAVERDTEGREWRWTTDRVPLTAGTRLVVIDLNGTGSYWTRAESDVVALFG